MTKNDFEALQKYRYATIVPLIPQPISKKKREEEREKLRKSLSEDLTVPGVYARWVKEACESKDADKLDDILSLGWALMVFDEESVNWLIKISLDNWVPAYELEDMTELIETYGGEDKVDALARMAVQKYPNAGYLGENDEAVARKCMWSLHRLYENHGNMSALEQIKKLAVCGDVMVEDLAKHHLQDYFKINC